MTDELSELSKQIDIEKLDSLDADVLVKITRKSTEAVVLLMNVATYVSCQSSVDGSNLEARAMQAKVRAMSSKLTQATQSASLAIKLAPDDKVAAYLAQCPEETFNVEHQRKLRDFTLSLAEENLITALSVDGNSAWSQLYTSISSTMTCQVADKHLGVAQAAALLASPDAAERRAAWEGIQRAWTDKEEAAAAVLNSISGWRLELNRRRAERAGKPVHYLDTALHQNRMTKKSLDAMMLVCPSTRAQHLLALAHARPWLEPQAQVEPQARAHARASSRAPCTRMGWQGIYLRRLWRSGVALRWGSRVSIACGWLPSALSAKVLLHQPHRLASHQTFLHVLHTPNTRLSRRARLWGSAPCGSRRAYSARRSYTPRI